MDNGTRQLILISILNQKTNQIYLKKKFKSIHFGLAGCVARIKYGGDPMLSLNVISCEF